MTDPYRFDAAPYVLGALDHGDRAAFEAHLPGCRSCQASVAEFAGLPALLSQLPAEDVLALSDLPSAPQRRRPSPGRSAPSGPFGRDWRPTSDWPVPPNVSGSPDRPAVPGAPPPPAAGERPGRHPSAAGLNGQAPAHAGASAQPTPARESSSAPPPRPARRPPPAPDLVASLLIQVRRERRAARWRLAAGGLAAACLVAVGAVVVKDNVIDSPAARPTALAFEVRNDAPVQASASLVGEPWGTRIDMRCTYHGSLGADGHPWVYALWATDRAGRATQVSQWQALPAQEVEVPTGVAIARDQLAALDVRTAAGATVAHLSL